MSSAKLAANQLNAQKSTGPLTEAGKATSARNATTHGLTSKQVVLPGENLEEFEALKSSLIQGYDPKTDLEHSLLNEFAACSWRLNRARRVETAFLAKLTEGSSDPATAIAVAFLEKPAELQRVMRYVTAIERAYSRALNILEKTVKARLFAEQQQEILAAAHQQLGFVSQKAQSAPIPPEIEIAKAATAGSQYPLPEQRAA